MTRAPTTTPPPSDRLALAAERGYTVSHFVMRPFGITPKNDVIVGYPSDALYLCSCNYLFTTILKIAQTPSRAPSQHESAKKGKKEAVTV